MTDKQIIERTLKKIEHRLKECQSSVIALDLRIEEQKKALNDFMTENDDYLISINLVPKAQELEYSIKTKGRILTKMAEYEQIREWCGKPKKEVKCPDFAEKEKPTVNRKHDMAVVAAYTGVLMGDFNDYHEYIENIMDREVYTHEIPSLAMQICERSKSDWEELLSRCTEEEKKVLIDVDTSGGRKGGEQFIELANKWKKESVNG